MSEHIDYRNNLEQILLFTSGKHCLASQRLENSLAL